MRYPALDWFRGLAALWVFVFHYTLPSEAFPHPLPPLLSGVFGLGHLGVSMFFVISGYCLVASAQSSLARNEPARRFLWRRAVRIYPPFWCSIAVILALPVLVELLSSLKTGTFVWPTNHKQAGLAIGDWLLMGSLAQVFMPGGEGLPVKFQTVNTVYWSLAIEVQFYVVVAVALTLGKRLYAFLGIVTALALASLVVHPSLGNTGVFLPYWPSFALGIGLYWCLERNWALEGWLRTRNALVVSSIGCGGLLGMFILTMVGTDIDAKTHIDWGRRPLAFAVFFTVFLWTLRPVSTAIGARSWSTQVRLFVAPVSLLGAMSYSIYLLHTKLVFLAEQIIRQGAAPGSVAYHVLTVACTCLLCYLFYLCCERPFVRGKASNRAERMPSVVKIAKAHEKDVACALPQPACSPSIPG